MMLLIDYIEGLTICIMLVTMGLLVRHNNQLNKRITILESLVFSEPPSMFEGEDYDD